MDRLDLIASLSKGSKTILDIGCDHAITVINAITKYGVNFAIASDINAGPLKQAEINIKKSHLEDEVKLVLSDGFKNINDDFDLAIISGLGGSTIINILNEGLNKLENKKIILSPHSDFYKVRSYLNDNNFIILDEYSIYDKNKYYEIILSEPGDIKYTLLELEFGPILLKKRPNEFIKHLENEKEVLNNAINRMDKDNINYQRLKEKIKNLEVVINGDY